MDDVTKKRALAGDIDALRALTQKLIKRENSRNQNLATNLLTDAYNNMPSSASNLGNQLVNGSDLFEKDRELGLTWLAYSGSKKINVDTAQSQDSDAPGSMPDGNGGSDKKTLSTFRRIEPDPHTDPFQQLDKLIGLENVKAEITEQASLMQFEVKRKQSGLPASNPSAHFIFTGNPGTGKTTVARIIGGIFKKIGHLQNGHVIEVSIPEMIGQYVGETPQKVLAALQAAMGGVLFIDEAYGLLSSQSGGGDAYGEQAVTTILKFMEDNRDNITIIAAGYPDKMEDFLESNPGFKSRFSDIVMFEDYKQDELCKIYLSYVAEQKYRVADDAAALVPKIMGEAPALFDKDFPNARMVRNLFEDTIKFMALRVMKEQSPAQDDLIVIAADDISKAYDELQKNAKFKSAGKGSGGLLKDAAKYGYQ